MKVIIYKNEQGGVSVCQPTGELSIEDVLDKDCPDHALIIDSSELPEQDNKGKKVLPTYERLHELFEYKNGCLFYKNDLYDSLGRATAIKKGFKAGSLHPLGYRKLRVDGIIYMEHRIIWVMFNKESPELDIDHINNDRSDNRIENLRVVSRSKNMMNASLRKDNTSGVKGVTWNNRDKRWTATIMVNKSKKCLGNYVDLELAELVVQEARLKFHGVYANNG